MKEGEVVILPAFGASVQVRPRCRTVPHNPCAVLPCAVFFVAHVARQPLAVAPRQNQSCCDSTGPQICCAALRCGNHLQGRPCLLTTQLPAPCCPLLQEMKLLSDRKVQIVDTTCPWVRCGAVATPPAWICWI